MREIDWDKVAIYAVGILLAMASVPLMKKLPRTQGKRVIPHVVFLVVTALLLLLLPDEIKQEIFSPGGVVVIGTLLPIYESVVALCTPGIGDDTHWLQYWVIAGFLSYTTEFMDRIRYYLPNAGDHWYEFEFFVTLWLLFPLTDGATLIYQQITAPYVLPLAQKVTTISEGWIQVLLTIVNTSHIFILWFVFTRLPEEARRFVVVAVGTVYPMAASIVATSATLGLQKDVVAKETTVDKISKLFSLKQMKKRDKTQDIIYWLTYWASFSLLFLAMDYVENFVGHITGFYSLCLLGTVYLFLPMFAGANVVFRRVLVPLAGQYENLLLHDAYMVRRSMEEAIPEQYQKDVLAKAAMIFAQQQETKSD